VFRQSKLGQTGVPYPISGLTEARSWRQRISASEEIKALSKGNLLMIPSSLDNH
jgi:hypothetical protein